MHPTRGAGLMLKKFENHCLKCFKVVIKIINDTGTTAITITPGTFVTSRIRNHVLKLNMGFQNGRVRGSVGDVRYSKLCPL